MQLTITAPERTDRFEPIHLTDEDLDDLSSFTGLSTRACRDRVVGYSTDELTEAWHRAAPSTPAELVDFYRSTDLYIWDLMQWHASEARERYTDSLRWFATNHPPEAGFRRVFDFGCGIGSDTLFLAAAGYDVTAVDVGGPVLEFARHRFRRRRLHANFLESEGALPAPPGRFDAAVCFDVFEHLPDPLQAAARLVGGLRPGGILLQHGGFSGSDERPYHLEQGVERFGGIKWHVHLCGLGLITAHEMAYRKAGLIQALLPRSRYWFWRATGVWLLRVDRPLPAPAAARQPEPAPPAPVRAVTQEAPPQDGGLGGILEAVSRLPSSWHHHGSLETPALEALYRHAGRAPIEHSAETGTGKSTLLLSHMSRDHKVFTIADRDDTSHAAVIASPLLRRESVEFVIGPSQETLWDHVFTDPLDLVLLDGPHAYPFPDLEYYHLYPRLVTGGLLVLDDIHIPTVFNLFTFLREDAMFQLLEVVGTTAFFRRTTARSFPPAEDHWSLQAYNATRFPVSRWPEWGGLWPRLRGMVPARARKRLKVLVPGAIRRRLLP